MRAASTCGQWVHRERIIRAIQAGIEATGHRRGELRTLAKARLRRHAARGIRCGNASGALEEQLWAGGSKGLAWIPTRPTFEQVLLKLAGPTIQLEQKPAETKAR